MYQQIEADVKRINELKALRAKHREQLKNTERDLAREIKSLEMFAVTKMFYEDVTQKEMRELTGFSANRLRYLLYSYRKSVRLNTEFKQ